MSHLPPHAVPSRRLQAAALLVPLLGLFLLLPPFVTLFGGPARVFGVPLIVFYVFAVWVALTLVAALLARRLPLTENEALAEPVEPTRADMPPP